MTPFINLEVGTLVRYRYGGEAWAFSAQTTRDKHWKVQSIHINQASNGVAHSVWLRLEGRQVPISLGEVTVAPTSAQREGQASVMSRTTSANNVRPIAPEVKRDAYGSYLPGDRSPAMARAITADIRRRALTEPGYLDHYKADAASELPTVAQSTSRHAAGRASHALQAAAPAPRRSARLARPARAPAPAISARVRRIARHDLGGAGGRTAGASAPAPRLSGGLLRSWFIAFQWFARAQLLPATARATGGHP